MIVFLIFFNIIDILIVRLLNCPSNVTKRQKFNLSIEYFGFSQNLNISFGDSTSITLFNTNGINEVINRTMNKTFMKAGFYNVQVYDIFKNYTSNCSIEVPESDWLELKCLPNIVKLNDTVFCNISVISKLPRFNFTVYFSDMKNNTVIYSIGHLFNFNRTFTMFGNYSVSVYEPNIDKFDNKTIVVVGGNFHLQQGNYKFLINFLLLKPI